MIIFVNSCEPVEISNSHSRVVINPRQIRLTINGFIVCLIEENLITPLTLVSLITIFMLVRICQVRSKTSALIHLGQVLLYFDHLRRDLDFQIIVSHTVLSNICLRVRMLMVSNFSFITYTVLFCLSNITVASTREKSIRKVVSSD